MSDQVSVRLAVVGGNQFRQELRQSAGDGARAMQQLGTATRGVSPAFVQVANSARQMFGSFAGGNSALMSFISSLSLATVGGGAFGLVVGTVLSGVTALVPQLRQTGQNARQAAQGMNELQGSVGAVNGAVSALEQVQRDYLAAINAQGGASNAAAAAVIANSKAEFDARKEVLKIELDILSIRADRQRADLARAEVQYRSDAAAAIKYQGELNAFRNREPGKPEPMAPSSGAFDAWFEDPKNKTRGYELRRLRAELQLTDLALDKTKKAMDTTFADITTGGPGTGSTDPGKGGKAGGGRGQSAAEKMAQEAQKIFDSTRTAAERYAAEMAKLNELLRQGAIDQETYNRAASQLRAEFEASEKFAAGVASQVRSSMTALFDSIIDGGKNAGQVIEDLGKKLLSMALQESVFRLFAKLMPSTFGPGGFVPLIGNATGNAFSGGKVIPFARGGVVSGPTLFPMRGATGMMGEAGPEAIMPLTRIGGKLGVAAAGGGGVVVKHEVHNYTGAEVSTRESSGPNGERIIQTMVGKQLGSGAHDSVLRSRFGSRPDRVKR